MYPGLLYDIHRNNDQIITYEMMCKPVEVHIYSVSKLLLHILNGT